MIALKYQALLSLLVSIENSPNSRNAFTLKATKETLAFFKNTQTVFRSLKEVTANNQHQFRHVVLLDDAYGTKNAATNEWTLKEAIRLRFIIYPKTLVAQQATLTVAGKQAHFAKIPFARPLLYWNGSDNIAQPVHLNSFVGLASPQLAFPNSLNAQLKNKTTNIAIPPILNEASNQETTVFDVRQAPSDLYTLTLNGEDFQLYIDANLRKNPPIGLVDFTFPAGTQTISDFNLILK